MSIHPSLPKHAVATVGLILLMITLGAPAPAAAAANCPLMKSSVNEVGPQAVTESVHCIVNAERQARGLDPLAYDNSLGKAALGHSRDMAKRGYFDHDSPPPNSTSPSERARDAGYPSSFVGENIYLGPTTAYDLVEGWMASSGHCRNILYSLYEDFGFGIASSGGSWYSTQLFGRHSSNYPDEVKRTCPSGLKANYASGACGDATLKMKKAGKSLRKAKKSLRKAKRQDASKRKIKRLSKKVDKRKAKRNKAKANKKAVCSG